MCWLQQHIVKTKELVMSRKLLLLAASVALLSGVATLAQAADMIDPPVVDLPEPVMPVAAPAHGGWYIRGDIGYSKNKMGDITYDTFSGGAFGSGLLRGELSNNYSIGGGIGYDTGNYLRLDLTADYFSKSNFSGNSYCTIAGVSQVCSNDSATMKAFSLLANAYVDLGKFGGFTPYVGAGIGGTNVDWGTLNNVCTAAAIAAGQCGSSTHGGDSGIRFTYALMAGASYDVSDCVAIDAGYRYRKVEGGKMFGIAAIGNPGAGDDHGFKSHEFRLGARYKFGGCGASHMPEYQPDYQPVYK
jgi:opacity protein-like surface antigen